MCSSLFENALQIQPNALAISPPRPRAAVTMAPNKMRKLVVRMRSAFSSWDHSPCIRPDQTDREAD
jgi:hypothetical protein